LPVECADINSTPEYSGRGVDIITDLNFADLLPVVGIHRVKPAGFVAEDQTPVDEWRRSPDRAARFVAPDECACVSGQAMKIAVVRTDIDAAFGDDRAGPDAVSFFADPALRLVLPNQFAVVLPVAIDVAVLSRRVNKTVRDCGRRIRIGADTCFPDRRTVRQ